MEVIDLTDIQWERNLTSYTSGGAYLKAAKTGDGGRFFFKLSNYDNERGFIGFESAYEYLAAKLGLFLDLMVLDCEILKARIIHNHQEYITFVQKTADFLHSGMTKTAFEQLYLLERLEGESRLDFLRRQGFSERADEMLLFDYIIYNRDRHCNNLEFIKNDTLLLSPLFDNGVSFFAPYAGRRVEIENFDVLSNNISNSDFGTRYLEDNLKYIRNTESIIPRLEHVNESDLFEKLFMVFDEDEDFPVWHRNRCMELILKRMHHAREVLNH